MEKNTTPCFNLAEGSPSAPDRLIGATDPATGRVAVRASDFAGSALNGEAYAYWRAQSSDPWRKVDAVDARSGGFDVCFADGGVREAGSQAVLWLDAGDAARMVA